MTFISAPTAKAVGELSLRQAREEWQELKLWGKEMGRDLRNKKRDELLKLKVQVALPTLAERRLKTETIKDYRNILQNIVLPELGGHTRISDYSKAAFTAVLQSQRIPHCN